MSVAGRLRLLVVLTGVLVMVTTVACAGSTSRTTTSQAAATSTNPVLRSDGGVSNVTFYYQKIDSGADLSKLGSPSIVAATAATDDQASIDAIHDIGAKAYLYLQFYWAPEDEGYEGINLQQHPEWAFCREKNVLGQDVKLLGRKTNGGTQDWYFIDTNETAVRTRFTEILEGVESAGWDGVMFDRGEAATQHATDYYGRDNWNQRSVCTESPHEPGATFSDAYVNMLGLAGDAGLEVMVNNGKSPFDPVTPMRPNPADPDCADVTSPACGDLSDAWPQVDLVLNETAARPKVESWKRTFAGNRHSEQSASWGRRTVGLVTTATLGGEQNQTKPNVFYQWSRIKLFDLAVAVNTGDDKCAGTTGYCNRYGLYPKLVNTTFGKPLSTGPAKQACINRSTVTCVWTRKYRKGVNVLNASSKRRDDFPVTLGTSGCRHVLNVFTGKPLASNRCVTKVRLDLPAWSGRPLRYSTNRW